MAGPTVTSFATATVSSLWTNTVKVAQPMVEKHKDMRKWIALSVEGCWGTRGDGTG
jgi:hypothetical protein